MKLIPHFTPRPRISPALLLRFLSGAYGALLRFSGTLKLRDIAAFSAALDGSTIVPSGMQSCVAVAIQLLEIGLWADLLADIRPALVCGFATAVPGIFTGVVAEKLLDGVMVSSVALVRSLATLFRTVARVKSSRECTPRSLPRYQHARIISFSHS